MRHLGKVAVLLALLAVPAEAHGATLFGGTLDGAVPDNSLDGRTTFNYAIAGTQLTAPSSGVITRIRVRHGATNATPGSVGFRILTETTFPTFAARHATPGGAGQRIHLPPNSPSGIVSYTPNDGNERRIGIPVAAGERLAVHQSGPATIASEFNGPHQVRWFMADHASGTQSYGTGAFLRAQIDALLEPDRDRDRYGDETQDNCPSVANDQTTNPCPPATVTVSVPGPAPAPVVVERVVPGPAAAPTRLCTVPRLRGLTLAAATMRLRRAGCLRGRRTGSRSRRARVRTQTVPAGTRVAAGTRVGVSMRVPGSRRRR